MVFRLLYRLFLQGIDQHRHKQRLSQATSTLAMPYQGEVVSQDDKYRVLKRGFAFTIVFSGLFVLGWQIFIPPASKIMDIDHAELRLKILSSNTWPVVAYLQGTGLPKPEASSALPKISQIESVKGNFAPVFQTLTPGGTIEIINSDPIAHNTHIFNRGDTIFNVALPLSGVTVKKTLTGSGIFSVRCDLHPWMQAWLFVPPSRYYAVLHEPNLVRFPDVPPGQYVLHLWQSDRAEQIRLIDLAAGESKTLHLH